MSVPTTQPAQQPTQQYRPDAAMTKKEAAQATGASVDTIKRRIEDGTLSTFPREGDNRGTLLIPVTELVAAGLLGADALRDVAETVATAKHGREAGALETARQDLALQVAALQARVTGLEAQLAGAVDERDFLRGLITGTGAGALKAA
ncbi:hypothetical protein ASC77_19945 [Nocardioides sp. Root1257]|uniref:hypothetical protein n=1 Tax=unclassified Nocardioides TaxID=2615069 RepID=UPI0006FA07B7|nr:MULTISPECIES: hypothetical protein [unclassified Nocardioides]KQW45056.1 hypothetical protein ASC77_19945 [Nocardioides sp. Root1257]KRC45940.1 hypothetical protein ASE24_15275 [Nocardioides sp. Root224]